MINGGVLLGIEGRVVGVETSIRGGLPGLEIVGLAGRTVQEAARRVRSALASSGFKLPPRQIIVSLVPADLPKHGVSLDLPIAVALLRATGHLPAAQDCCTAYWGQLGLDGRVRPAPGVLPFTVAARRAGLTRIVTAAEDAQLASLGGLEVWVVRSLDEFGRGGPGRPDPAPAPGPPPQVGASVSAFNVVASQAGPLRAAVIAAAGGHHCCFFGPPGAGKSLLARAVHALLPAATGDELIEIAGMAALGRCESREGATGPGPIERPLRQPLTGISLAAMLGRARPFAAGEVSLAHGGVLVLDEVGHHRPDVISALCLCLDRGWVALQTEGAPLRLPARAQIAATSNLCPCGRLGSPGGGCTCSSQAKAAFWRRLSAAFLDRIDMQVEVVGPELYDLQVQPLAGARAQQLEECRAEVTRAWEIAGARFGGPLRNATAGTEAEPLLQQLAPAARGLLGELHRDLCLSARGYLGVARVARTIADLAGHALIGVDDVAEAAAYRARFGPRPS